MKIIEQTIKMPKSAKYRAKTMDGKYYLYFDHKPKLTIFDEQIGLPTSNHSGWNFADGRSVLLKGNLRYEVPDYDVAYWKNSLVKIFANESIQKNTKQNKISVYEEIKTYKKELNLKDKRIHDLRMRVTEKNAKIKNLEDEIAILEVSSYAMKMVQGQLDRTEQHLRSAENALQYKEHIILFLKGEISDGWDRRDD